MQFHQKETDKQDLMPKRAVPNFQGAVPNLDAKNRRSRRVLPVLPMPVLPIGGFICHKEQERQEKQER